jgi:hypothetical protein
MADNQKEQERFTQQYGVYLTSFPQNTKHFSALVHNSDTAEQNYNM